MNLIEADMSLGSIDQFHPSPMANRLTIKQRPFNSIPVRLPFNTTEKSVGVNDASTIARILKQHVVIRCEHMKDAVSIGERIDKFLNEPNSSFPSLSDEQGPYLQTQCRFR